MLKKLIVIINLFIPVIVFAQNGSISGKIVESSTKQPVEFATIALMANGNNVVIKQEVSNAKGVYKFLDIVSEIHPLLILMHL